MGKVEKDNLVGWFINYSKDMVADSIDKKYILLKAIKNNISIILMIWFLGLTMLGTPIILVVNLIKGFTIGFTSSLVIKGLGTKGILLNLLVVFPQNIIYIPCIIICSVLAIEFSLILLRTNSTQILNRKNMLLQATTYSTIFIFLMGFMFIGFLIEGYITPSMLKLIVHNLGSTLI
jgi:stage II sporulation protein M